MATAPKHITFSNALAKARHFCAYQERCHFDVENKLQEWGLLRDFIPAVCVTLAEEGYLNEERYVSAYIRGKLNQNGWGRIKIKIGLKEKHISPKMMEIGFKEISNEHYYSKLLEILTAKAKNIRSKNAYEHHQKLFNFALRRGFESNIITEVLDDLKNAH